MRERSSRSVQETRDREAWLVHLLEGESASRDDLAPLLATASLVRATADQIEVPAGAEEASRRRALAELASLRQQQRTEPLPRAPWFTRIGSAMRFVFTLGKRR